MRWLGGENLGKFVYFGISHRYIIELREGASRAKSNSYTKVCKKEEGGEERKSKLEK